MAENPMTEREVKRFRVWLKPFDEMRRKCDANRNGLTGAGLG